MLHILYIYIYPQSCLTLCNPMDYSSPGSGVHVILQERIMEWAAVSFSRESSQPRDWTWISCIAGRCFTVWATREAHYTCINLKRVKEESEKVGLKLNIQKTMIMASSPITSWQIDGEIVETVADYFSRLQNHCRWWLQPWN